VVKENIITDDWKLIQKLYRNKLTLQ